MKDPQASRAWHQLNWQERLQVLLAEKLLYWALSLMPPCQARTVLAVMCKGYAHTMASDMMKVPN